MREIQHLTRLYVAWLFVCAEETKLKSADNLKVMQDNIAQMQATMAENESKIQELSAQIKELQKKIDQVHWKKWNGFKNYVQILVAALPATACPFFVPQLFQMLKCWLQTS